MSELKALTAKSIALAEQNMMFSSPILVYLKGKADRHIKNLKRAIWIAKAERFKSGYFHFDLEKDFWKDRGEKEKENHYYEKREQCARLEKICRQRAKKLEND
jgi:hypothetical protein